MFTRVLRLLFYILLGAQVFHLVAMQLIKLSLGAYPITYPHPMTMGVWWWILFWGWIVLFVTALLSHLWRGPLREKEAAFGFAIALVLPVFHDLIP